MEKHPLHFKMPDLQTSPEVARAVEREERYAEQVNEELRESGQEGPLLREKVKNDPADRIEAYMDRLENIFLNPDERKRERNLEMFREKIYDALIIKRENFPESYFELQQRIARERGQAVETIPESVREQMKDVAIEDQKHSLDAWMDYLTSPDAVYPAWFKYYVWNQITKLSQFDKERGEFKKRTDSTVAPFPDIYREPLAQIADIYEKVKQDNKNLKDPEIQQAFSKKFPALYAELIQESLAASIESREEIRGEWVKYEQGDGAASEKLFESLEGKGTGWCTAGRSTAETQIESGDFYVYYTNDASGSPTQPRLAIRMDGNSSIGEVRGILPHQGVEPALQEVLDGKLSEFGGEADAYRKKSEDMRTLTILEKKYQDGQSFTKEDLVFLYEINGTIEGFGYQKDPRVAELRKTRNPKEDAPIVFECRSEEIAWSEKEINEKTKAYIGPLFAGIFSKNIEHVYTAFPEGKIREYHIEIGGISKENIESKLQEKKIYISDWGAQLLNSEDFRKSLEQRTVPEKADLVRLTVADLGFANGATTEKIFHKAEELGLELCPPEVGPEFRLAYQGKEYIFIGMKQILDRDGDPSVFGVGSGGAGLVLVASSAEPASGWYSHDRFLFRLRKQKLASSES